MPVIRRATAEDIDAVFSLYSQLGDYHAVEAPAMFNAPTAEDKALLSKLIEAPERACFVAQNTSGVIGFLLATIGAEETMPALRKPPVCRVSVLVVDHQHRKKGIGSRLMQVCREWACEQGLSEIRLQVMAFNHAAQAFYRSQGFATQSRILSSAVE